MIKPLFYLVFFFFCCLQSHSKKLVYKSNGTIFDPKNKEVSPYSILQLLKSSEKLLKEYTIGRTKKTSGNILLIFGTILIVTGTFAYVFSGFESSINGVYVDESDRLIPKIIAFVGLAELLMAIPVKIGFFNKIINAVTNYNDKNPTRYKQCNEPRLGLIAHSNGIGLRLTLN